MAWWIYVIISAAFQVVSGLLTRHPNQKPEQQLNYPTNDGSRQIPVVFGECLVKDPFLVDYFDFSYEPIKVINGATFGITKITVGYRYFVGMVFGLAWAKGTAFDVNNPTIKSITIDNREIYSGSTTPSPSGTYTIDINKPSYFGSEKTEGGIRSRIVYYDGSDPGGYLGYTKTSDPYWEAQRGLTLPHYKNLAYAVWYGPNSGVTISGKRSGYIGNTPNLWPIGFKLVRFPHYLGTSGTRTIGDTPNSNGDNANPVECLYEVLTNEFYGCNIPASQIDTTSFINAIQAVWSEGLGFSYYWTTGSAEEMVAEILRYIDASLWTDLSTGKVKIKLIRAEDISGLTVYNNDDFVQIENFTRGSWEDTKNEVRLTFPDHSKIDFEDTTFEWFEPGNYQTQGSAAEELTFKGCPSARIASRLASREGRVLSTPLARLTGKIDRKAWNVEPGGLFKYTDPQLGISNLVMRVGNLKLGTLTDGRITITAIQDVFAAGTETYGVGVTSIWTDPVAGEASDATGVVGEIPYFIQQDSFNRIFGMAVRPSAAHLDYDGSLNTETQIFNIDFTPSGLLSAILPQVSQGDYDTTGFSAITWTDASAVVAGTVSQITAGSEGLAILGDPASNHEWIAFESVSGTTTLTFDNVWRGLLDTPPREWPAGTRIWCFSVGAGLFENSLTTGLLCTFEALTRTLRDQLDVSEATNRTYTLQQRAYRPLPPFYVLMGGSYTNEEQSTGDVVLTWRQHSRLTLLTIIKQSATDETAEAGTTWELDIWNDSGGTATLLRSVTALSSATYTYTNANELSDLGTGSLATRLRIDLYAKRDVLRSLYPFSRYVYRTAPGSFGNGDWIIPAIVFDDPHASDSVTGWDELGIQIFGEES